MIENLIIDIFCVLIISAILISHNMQKKHKDIAFMRFTILGHVFILFALINFTCNFLDGKPQYTTALYIFNFLSFVSADAIILSYIAYFSTFFSNSKKKNEFLLEPITFITYLRVIAIVVLFSIGKLFTIDEGGHYSEYSITVIPYIFSLISIAMILFKLLRNGKVFNAEQKRVTVFYMFIPFLGGVLDEIFKTYIYFSMSLTLSILLIYATLQASIIENARIREKELEKLSFVDPLTEVNNRNAYYTLLSALDPHQNVGIVFCDVNGLKYVNDTFGHSEGDKLLISFSELAMKQFDKKDIFRIGGDEFLILLTDIQKDDFENKLTAFENLLKSNNYIAASGATYGTVRYIEQLVLTAEEKMYVQKRASIKQKTNA